MSNNHMILTISVAPTRDIIDHAYDIPSIAQHVSLTNVMTYNFHGPWEHYTHHHSGLYAFSEDSGGSLFMNVVSAAGDAMVTPLRWLYYETS